MTATSPSSNPATASADFGRRIRVGLFGGIVGGTTIWIYEAAVVVGAERQMPLTGIPANATGLVFGKAVQASLGFGSYVLGTAIHIVFALAWGVVFALIWPAFRRRGWEATLLALFFALFASTVMHAAIAVVSNNHPDYLDPVVIIGSFVTHIFYTVPLALTVKRRLA